MKDFDAIVVGAGPAGCLAAREIAGRGLSVGLFDSASREKLGKPLVVEVEWDIRQRVGLPPIEMGEVVYHPEKVMLWSSGGNRGCSIDGSGARSVRLDEFVSKLAGDAEAEGTQFFGKHKALDVVYKGGMVTGVKFRVGRKHETATAAVVIDATGFNAALVRKMDPDPGMDFSDDPQDIVAAANYVHKIKDGDLGKAEGDDLCRNNQVWSYIGKYGNYSTEFVIPDSDKKQAYVLIGIKKGNPESMAVLLKEFYKKHWYYGKKLYGGSADIRINHSLPRLVTDGFMTIGEAACQVIPIHGSGVSTAMLAGKIAGEVAATAIRSGDTSTKSLWPYAYRYQTGRGKMLAMLDVSRRFTEAITSDQCERMISRQMITSEDLQAAGEIKVKTPSLRSIYTRLACFATNPDLAAIAGKIGYHGAKVLLHYSKYPRTYAPATFEAWRKKEARLFAPLKEL